MAKIFVSGDVVNYEKTDGLLCSDELADRITEADYAICNFEAPIQGAGEAVKKSGVHHSQLPQTISGLKEQGFDLLCLANNHMMDYGKTGLNKTIQEIKAANLECIGAGSNFREAYQPLIKEINGMKIGFINACEAQFGVIDYFRETGAGYAWINHREIDEQIIALKKQCDFVILLAHAGLEHYDIPQKEWRHRYKHFCNIGADAIIGSHPHVPQGYEYHNDSIIFYSLGNFYFDSKNFRAKEDRSFSVILELEKNKSVNFIPVYHHKEKGTVQVSSPEKQIDLAGLNAKLESNYENLHNKMSSEIYNNKVKGNLIYSLLTVPYDGSIKSSLKRILRRVIKNKKQGNRDLLLLHLLRNEAYYYAARHALELTTKEKYGWDKHE